MTWSKVSRFIRGLWRFDFTDLSFLYVVCWFTIALVYTIFFASRHYLIKQQTEAMNLVHQIAIQRDSATELERLIAFAQDHTASHYSVTAHELMNTYTSLARGRNGLLDVRGTLLSGCSTRICNHIFSDSVFAYTPAELQMRLFDTELKNTQLNRTLQKIFSSIVNYDLALKDAMDLTFSQIRQGNANNSTFDLLAYLTLIVLLLMQSIYIFRPAIRRLNDSLSTRSDFLSRISHEIRNPMNSILGMAEILKGTRLNFEQHQYIDNLLRSGHALLDMLNNLVDFSVVEHGKMTLQNEPFDLFACIDRALNLIAVSAHHRGLNLYLTVSPELPNALIGDPIRLDQVLINLLNNATKFTEEGYIVLSIDVANATEESVNLHISITDSGVGIAENLLDKIFESFVQGDSSIKRKHGGAGLGLSISSEIVRLMGGRINVESRVGQGSTFSFEIQLKKQRGRNEAPLEYIRQRHMIFLAATPKLEFYQAALKKLGGNTEMSTNAKDLRQLLQQKGGQETEEIVIDDSVGLIAMINCRNVCEEFALGDRCVALIQSNFTQENMDLLKRNGFNRFLIKPLKPWELLSLPLAQQMAENPETRNESNGGKAVNLLKEKYLKFLLVDDSNDNLFLLKEILEPLAAKIEFAENGLTAIDKFRNGNYDVLFMDIQMPVMDGYTAIRRIREMERVSNGKIPIFAVTAHGGLVDAQKCREAGFTERIVKPVVRQQIYRSLLNAFHIDAQDLAYQPDDILPAKYLTRLMPMYFKTRFDDLAKLRAAVTAADFETMKNLGHKIKGSAASYGFPHAAELSQSLERNALNLDLKGCTRTIDQLEQVFRSEFARFGRPPESGLS